MPVRVAFGHVNIVHPRVQGDEYDEGYAGRYGLGLNWAKLPRFGILLVLHVSSC